MQIPILVVYSKSLHHFGWAISKQNAAFAISVFNHSINSPGRLFPTGAAAPHLSAKLVRVIKGRVLDVAVDMRRSSPTFGRYVSVELSEDNKRQFFIPRGFAHGFLVLSEEAIFTYKVDNAYAPQAEASVRYNDETIGIDWPIGEEQLLLSEKDARAVSFQDAEYFD